MRVHYIIVRINPKSLHKLARAHCILNWLGISIARGGRYIRMRCGCREMRWFVISSYLCMGQCPRVPLFLTCVVQDHCLHSGYEDAAIRWDTVPAEYKSRYDRKMLTENRSKHIDWFCLTFGTSNSCLYKELCDDTTCVTNIPSGQSSAKLPVTRSLGHSVTRSLGNPIFPSSNSLCPLTN